MTPLMKTFLENNPAHQPINYYIGYGQQAKGLIDEANKLLLTHIKAKDRLNDTTVKADHIYSHMGNILGFAWDVEFNDRPQDRTPQGLRFWRVEETAGLYMHIYKPDIDTPAGQALIEQIRALGGFTTGNFLSQRLGVDLSTQAGTAERPKRPALLNSLVTYMGTTLFVQIPQLHASQKVTLPAWMRKVNEREFYSDMSSEEQKHHTRVRAAIGNTKAVKS